MKKLILLLIVLICGILLASCGDAANQPSDVTEETTVQLNPITADYTFIRPDRMEADQIKASMALRDAVLSKYGLDLVLTSDWSADNRENATVESGPEVHEILIGDTNRAESRAVAEEYAESQGCYVIKSVNGKIVIWGSDASFLSSAIDYFMNELMPEGQLAFHEGVLRAFDLYAEGSPLSLISKEYSVVFSGSSRVMDAADRLAGTIERYTEASISVNKEQRDKEILIGETDREELKSVAADLSYSDYTIRISGDKIILIGGSPLATVNAVERFSSMLFNGELQSLEPGIIYDYDFDKLIEDSLVNNLDSFVPVWADEFTPADWMHDYEEKLHTLVTKTGRISSDAHRGDTQNYPENSLEGIYSAILLGADVVEIDVRLTKDNIMVLMHDASLKRMTSWAMKSGRNGLPESDQISDWTYEQLCELRLMYKGRVTEYKIPTLYEVAQLFSKRAQIHLDKKADAIDVDTDIYLLAEATGSKESFLYYYGLDTMHTWMNKNKEDTEFADFYNKMKALGASSMRRRNTSVYDDYADAPDGWKKCFIAGYPKMLTNCIYDFARFSAAEQQPTKYN